MNIYVGNLSFDAEEGELQKLFEEFGEVTSAKIISDKYSGKSRGFAFVEMADDSQGSKAISQLDGKDYLGRALRVSEARPRTERQNR